MTELFKNYLFIASIISILIEALFLLFGGIPDTFGYLFLLNSEFWSSVAEEDDFFFLLFYLPIVLFPLLLITYIGLFPKIELKHLRLFSKFISTLKKGFLSVFKIFLLGISTVSIQYVPFGIALIIYTFHREYRSGILKYLLDYSIPIIVSTSIFFFVFPFEFADSETVLQWLIPAALIYYFLYWVQKFNRWLLLAAVPIVIYLSYGFLAFVFFTI